MITTPLAPIVAHFRKHGADLACLEGAPYLLLKVVGLHAVDVRDGEPMTASGASLYLGSGPICPAALGWAAQVLALTRNVHHSLTIEAWEGTIILSHGGLYSREMVMWRWGEPNDGGAILLPGPMPTAPSARLRAVLEYEVGR